MRIFLPVSLTVWGVASIFAATPSWEAPPAQQTSGSFWRFHWYERGLTNGNPAYERRFRINSPEAVLHPAFGKRIEARENGLMLIHAEEDLFQITGAEFYAEMWGGHPGTANKRFTVNGRSTYYLLRVGAEEGHCTYYYPVVPLKILDLVNGYDAFQFALDQGSTFWAHALIDNACVRVALTNGHPDVLSAVLANFMPGVEIGPDATGEERYRIRLAGAENFEARIASVEFQAWHYGYDENGNTVRTD